jgi:hypothetical protein
MGSLAGVWGRPASVTQRVGCSSSGAAESKMLSGETLLINSALLWCIGEGLRATVAHHAVQKSFAGDRACQEAALCRAVNLG